jgi:hypothetical protein
MYPAAALRQTPQGRLQHRDQFFQVGQEGRAGNRLRRPAQLLGKLPRRGRAVQVLEDTHPGTGIGGYIGKPHFLTTTAFSTGFIHLVGKGDFP